MPGKQPSFILEDDVFSMKVKGLKELHGSETSLSATEIQVLVLIDAKSTVGEISACACIEFKEVAAILRKLAQHEMIEMTEAEGGSLNFVDTPEDQGPAVPSGVAAGEVEDAATASTKMLQQQGYFVRIARRVGTPTQVDRTRGNSILVVEDDPNLAQMLKLVLESVGFTVINAFNREDILAAFRRPPRPTLVLLDVMLPDVDGFDVLRKIREHPALTTLPVVMITAKSTRAAVLEGLKGGANGYITKPFAIPAVLKAVNVVLGLPENGRGDKALSA